MISGFALFLIYMCQETAFSEEYLGWDNRQWPSEIAPHRDEPGGPSGNEWVEVFLGQRQSFSVAHSPYFLSLGSEQPHAYSAFMKALFFPARCVKGKIRFSFPRCQPWLLLMPTSLQLLDEANGWKHLKGYALWFHCHNPCKTNQIQHSLTGFQPIIIWGLFKLQVWLNL